MDEVNSLLQNSERLSYNWSETLCSIIHVTYTSEEGLWDGVVTAYYL